MIISRRKKTFAVLAALVFSFSVMALTGTASGAENDVDPLDSNDYAAAGDIIPLDTGTQTLFFNISDGLFHLGSSSGTIYSAQDSYYDWNAVTGVLTLKGFDWETTAPVALEIFPQVPITIELELGSQNSFVSTSTGSAHSYGILSYDSVTVNGAGQLTARSGNVSDQFSYGIIVASLTVNGGTINATGGSSTTSYNGESIGIVAGGGATINSGTVVATGGYSDSHSIGIYTYGPEGVLVTSGTVIATGGSGDYISTGIFDSGSGGVSVSGGSLTTTAGYGGYLSVGIYSIGSGKSSISGGTLTTRGGTGGFSIGIYVSSVDSFSITGTGTVLEAQGSYRAFYAHPPTLPDAYTYRTNTGAPPTDPGSAANISVPSPGPEFDNTAASYTFVHIEAASASFPRSFTAVQSGGVSGTVDSSGIILTFDQPVTGLTAADITITNGSGSATKGTLSGSRTALVIERINDPLVRTGTIWIIALSGVAAEGDVIVIVNDFDVFQVVTAPQTVAVYKDTRPTYALTVTGGTGSGNYALGTPVNIASNTPPTGQVFDRWVIDSGGGSFADASSPTTTFYMPDNDASISATFKAAPDSTSITPPTGDDIKPMLLAVAFTISALGILVLPLARRKKYRSPNARWVMR